MRKCKVCQIRFNPRFNSFQKVCENPSCVISFMKSERAKESKRELKQMRDKSKTLSEWRKDLRVIFHQFIRLRDRNLPCISCGQKLPSKYDAGHFYSRGAFPNLAFDPLNVHAQCVYCNQHLSGNLIEYSINLPKRIGEDEFNRLRERRKDRRSLSIPEIKEMILYYKLKIKSIKTEML